MHEMWEALRDLQDLKPHLERRLAYIFHQGKELELREEVEDVRFYLGVMKDLVVFPRSHATEQVRSYISKIHDILRKGPVPPDFEPLPPPATSPPGQGNENDGDDEWSPHEQKPAPWMEVDATSDFYSAGRGAGRGHGRDVGRSGSGSGHGVGRGAATHFAPTEEVTWNEKEYYSRLLEQNFERRQPARQQTNQEHYIGSPPTPPLQDAGYFETSPQFYAQPQLIPVPVHQYPAVFYPPMIPALAPYSAFPLHSPSLHPQVDLSYAPLMGSQPADEPNFTHSRSRKRWRDNSKRFSRSSTPVPHAPVEYSAPVAPFLDQETRAHHHNPSGQQVRRRVTPQAVVTPVISRARSPERRIIGPRNPTPTQNAEEELQTTGEESECRPRRRLSACTTEVPSPPSSAGIRGLSMAKIPRKTPVVAGAGIRPGYRIPKISKIGPTSSAAAGALASSSRSASDSSSCCNSSLVSSEGFKEIPKFPLGVIPSTEEVTSTTDPEKESSSCDPQPLPDAKSVSSIGKKRALEGNSEAIPYPGPSTSVQTTKDSPRKKSSGSQKELKLLYAALEECNYDPRKVLKSTRRTRNGTLLGEDNQHESPEQPRARLPTPKKKTATPAKKDAGSSVKKPEKVTQEKMKEVARRVVFEKSPPATTPRRQLHESSSSSSSESEGESSELMNLITRAQEDKIKREQEEQERQKRLQDRFMRHLDKKVVGPRDTVVNRLLSKIKVEGDYDLETVKQEALVPEVEQEFDIQERLEIIQDSSQNVIYVNHEVDLDEDV